MKSIQMKCFISFLTISKLFLFLIFLIAINNVAAGPDPSNLFTIIHDENCRDDRSVLDVLLESQAFSKEEAADFEEELNSLVKQTREERLGMSIVNEEIHVRRRSSDMDWEDRRDQSISVLNFFRNNGSKTQRRLRASSQKSSVLYKHLKLLAMDIIHDDSGEILQIARKLSCLAHPPERNKAFHLLQAPNNFDPRRQWYLTSPPVGIGATDAWKCQNEQRNGTVVAVFDSGCNPHPNLKENLCSSDEDCFGFDAVNLFGNPNHGDNFHGTTVAGFIAAVSNDNSGITGVCPNCKIMCIKVSTGKGGAFETSIALGIHYVLSKKHIVKITNHSYGTYAHSHVVKAAFKKLHLAGILAIVGAGNDDCDMDQPYSKDECPDIRTGEPRGPFIPASYDFDNIITVGGSTREGHFFTRDTNYGKTKVHFIAPGEHLEGLSKDGYTSLHGGTSYSAAITSGAAAVIWAENQTMTYKQVKDILMETVSKVPVIEPYCVTGGILNLAAAMERVKERKSCSTPSFDSGPPNQASTLRNHILIKIYDWFEKVILGFDYGKESGAL